MTVLYLGFFIGGLLLAVRVMMYGVERTRENNATEAPSFRLSPALVVAFTTVFGLVGYVLTRRNAGSVATRMAIAGILGVGGALLAARLVRKWWRVAPKHDVDDERYVLQGHIARVTKPIAADVDGEVAYELGDRHHVVRARSFDAAALAVGTEVVIERIEDEVAYVESWMEVEKRL